MALSGMLKAGGTLVVVHFESSEGINRHHKANAAVARDFLPGREEMLDLFGKALLQVNLFIDESGFYCVRSVKL